MKTKIIVCAFLLSFITINVFTQDSIQQSNKVKEKELLKEHLPRVNLFFEFLGMGTYFSFNTEFRLLRIHNNAINFRFGFMSFSSISSTGILLNYNRMLNKNINIEAGIGISSFFETNGYVLAETYREETYYRNLLINMGVNFFIARNLLLKLNVYPAYTYYRYYFLYIPAFDETVRTDKYPRLLAGASIGYSFRKRMKNIYKTELERENYKKELETQRLNALNNKNNFFMNVLGISFLSLSYERVIYKKNKNSFSGEVALSPFTFFVGNPSISLLPYYKRDIFKHSQLEAGISQSFDTEHNYSTGYFLGYRNIISKELSAGIRFNYIQFKSLKTSLPMIGFYVAVGF